jgi:hypothetical protein
MDRLSSNITIGEGIIKFSLELSTTFLTSTQPVSNIFFNKNKYKILISSIFNTMGYIFICVIERSLRNSTDFNRLHPDNLFHPIVPDLWGTCSSMYQFRAMYTAT